ncbi:MAG: hypothetical protein LQ352_000070 [Teloschistes flavicans]|nr:MAG: hypothetical protein LQ352_000070 [Teloschistes flavicans]
MATGARDFRHPFQPYEIQQQLMNAVYDCISDGKVGIFESPTGTGKSLSLICSTLTWLRDEQKKVFDGELGLEYDEKEPTWIVEQGREQRMEALIQRRLDLEYRLAKIREKELRQKRGHEKGEPAAKRQKVTPDGQPRGVEDEGQFLLDDYESDDERKEQPSTRLEGHDGLSAATLQLMQKLGEPSAFLREDPDPEDPDEPKVFFCSRTHSQLTQFVNELRRVKLPRAFWQDNERVLSRVEDQQGHVVKHLPLGARKSLCINSKVASAGSAAAINESCLDLQQPSTPHEKRCSFLPNEENRGLVNDFRDHTFAKVRDIEDLGALGKRIGICPYYAARTAIRPSEVLSITFTLSYTLMAKILSQIVTLPYPLLLQKSAREALGISLKGHVVVVDEAHNLMDAITNIHSIVVTQDQLHRSRNQLRLYLQKFRNKLKGKNRIYVTQVVRVVDSIAQALDKMALEHKGSEVLIHLSDLMGGKGVDQINLYKLIRYLADSKLARKVEGYVEYAGECALGSSLSPTNTTPTLTHVQGFLETLMNPAAEGRFFFERGESSVVALKYILLDPTFHFRDVVEDAQAVVLAGGTMSPENLFVKAIAKAPDGMDMEFSFARRDSVALISALGGCLLQLAMTIPDGLVVFFPSYAYLEQASAQWQKTVAGKDNIWTRLEGQKAVFKELKGSPGVEDTLTQYSKAVDEGRGGILLSIVGGKMSEGINFSDKLGRGVAIVGLPFPNMQSAQWKAKLEYIEQSTVARGGSSAEGKVNGREFYENACMRAVNQSIGRAIRHRNDFASILLLDRRYSTPRIAGKLPGWIKQALREDDAVAGFPQIIRGLRDFFEGNI